MSSKASPFFSVICPVYNGEKFIDACVQSVVNQTFLDWELILIDDGSTDSTPFLCDSFSKTHDNILSVHLVNCGPYFSRVNGIKKAKGKYIVFVDCDDYLDVNALFILHKALVANYYPDCIIYNTSEIGIDGTIKTRTKIRDNVKIVGNGIILEKTFFKNIFWYVYEKCFKRTTLLDIEWNQNPFCFYKLGEDTLMSYLALRNCKDAVFSPETLYFYRRNNNSLTSDKTIEKYLNCFDIYSFIYNDILINHPQLFAISDNWANFYLDSFFAFAFLLSLQKNYKSFKLTITKFYSNRIFKKAINTKVFERKKRLLVLLIKKKMLFAFYAVQHLRKRKRNGK